LSNRYFSRLKAILWGISAMIMTGLPLPIADAYPRKFLVD